MCSSHRMPARPTSRYRSNWFPSEIISHAVRLYHRFSLSFRNAVELLAERRVIVSYEAACQVFQVRPGVCEEAPTPARPPRGHLAYRRVVYPYQGRDLLSLASGGSGWPDTRYSRTETVQYTGREAVLSEVFEGVTVRPQSVRHRRGTQLPGGSPDHLPLRLSLHNAVW